MSTRIAVIGECMIEIRPQKKSDGYKDPVIGAEIAFGGDTLNCAAYLARQGIDVQYVTMLGDDPMSDWMLSQWRQEGIGCELVGIRKNAVPGLYMINVDSSGERSFKYWRNSSPARQLLDDPAESEKLFSRLREFEGIYLSGITLSLYAHECRQRLYKFLESYRANGGRVYFDNNYRPAQWPDVDEAQTAFETMYRLSDIALPTLDDEQLLFGDKTADAAMQRLQGWGIKEIVLKLGPQGCLIADDTGVASVTTEPVKKVVDTTAAGDSFNAGYLGARLRGATARDSAMNGNRIAAVVIQHRGAIIARDLFDGVFTST